MKPADISAIRAATGMSTAEMASVIGLEGLNATDRVREMEGDRRPISAPVQRVLEYIAQGIDMGKNDLASMAQLLPKWMHCMSTSATGAPARTALLHAHWPRFIVVDSNGHAGLQVVSGPQLLQGTGTEAHPCSLWVLYIDRPVSESAELLTEAAAQWTSHSFRAPTDAAD